MRRIKISRLSLKNKRINTSRFTMYKPSSKLYNLMWELHKYDDDFFPSVPHGHIGKYKLDVMNGNVYQASTKQLVGHATKKELRILQTNGKFQEFALAHIQWYMQKYPQVPIEIPLWLQGKNAIKSHTNSKQEEIDILCFAMKIVMTEAE